MLGVLLRTSPILEFQLQNDMNLAAESTDCVLSVTCEYCEWIQLIYVLSCPFHGIVETTLMW